MATIDSTAAGHRKRLKERFAKTLLDGFHDYEVVELLLTYSIPRRDVKPAAKALIARFGGLAEIFEAGPEALASVKGIGEKTAMLIRLLRFTAREYLKERSAVRSRIRLPGDVVKFVGSAAGGGEELLAVYLNSKNEVLGVELLHKGALKSMRVSPKAAIRKAFKHNARSVVFVHNLGPGRSADFSKEELDLVRALKGAASTIDIIVHDHIVTGGGSFKSARENGTL